MNNVSGPVEKIRVKGRFRRVYIGALAAAVLIGVLGSIGVYYYFRTPSEPLPSAAGKPLPPAAFHADEVLEFQWETSDQVAVFQRASPRGEWTPAVDAQDVQSRLVLLTQIHRQPFPAKEPLPEVPFVKVTVRLNTGEMHIGAWNMSNFVWLHGPLRGQGAALSQEEALLFSAGRHAFDPKRLDWCRGRPVKFEIAKNKELWLVTQAQGRWKARQTSAGENSPERDLNATVFERWLGSNCSTRASLRLDEKLNLLAPHSQTAVTVHFADAHWRRFDLGAHQIVRFTASEAAVDPALYIAPRLADGLMSLTEIATTAP